MGITWNGVALSEAQHLADALAHRAALRPSVLEGVPLAAGEFAYGEFYVTGWRFFGLDTVFYERHTVLAGGGLLMLASAIGNRRRRREAEAYAAPQWRPLGALRVVVTPKRILVWHRQAWWSVWFAGVLDVHCFPDHQTLDLCFEVDAPYRLAGPGVPALGVIVSKPPQWFENLMVMPEAWLEVGTERIHVRAATLDRDEREVWWDRVTKKYPNYRVYQERTDRTIPVARLTPSGEN